MADVYCAKCGEPWDYHGIPRHQSDDGDMTYEEAEKFRHGKGCPCCGFDDGVCPTCSGAGKMTHDYGNVCCQNGWVLAWSPAGTSHSFRKGEWYVGYHPNVKHIPDPVKVQRVEGYQSRDGWVFQYMIQCPECRGEGDHLIACPECDGTGKLKVDKDLELKAARSECAISDEDPMEILIRRGLC
jgi:hypothetical protein